MLLAGDMVKTEAGVEKLEKSNLDKLIDKRTNLSDPNEYKILIIGHRGPQMCGEENG